MSPLRVLIATAAIVAAALTIGAFAVAQLAEADSRKDRANNPGRTTTAPPPTATSPAASPDRAGSGTRSSGADRVGLVTYTAVAGDPRAGEVAAMFDNFFDAINAGDYDRALDYYDPAGQIDTTDPAERADFAEGVATSTDRDVVIHSLAEDSAGNLVATVTFTSEQAPDKAPNGQACTHWRITYTLSRPAGGYRIFKGTASHDSCY